MNEETKKIFISLSDEGKQQVLEFIEQLLKQEKQNHINS